MTDKGMVDLHGMRNTKKRAMDLVNTAENIELEARKHTLD